MSLDMHAKSVELLEKLANSIYDRDSSIIANNPCFFTATEIQVTKDFLQEILNEKAHEG